MLLEGLFLPLTTPFYGDGRLYLRKLEHNAERYSRTLAAGLALLTPFGEPERLTDAERREALKTAAEATARETLLLADISHAGVAGALEIAEAAALFRYDLALLRLPTLASGATVTEQRVLAQAVADRSPLPIILLEERREALPAELVAELAQHPQIVGFVASASPVEGVREVLSRTAEISREVDVTTVFAAVTGRMLDRRVVPGVASYITAESLTKANGTTLATLPSEPAIKTRVKRVGFQVLVGRTDGALEMLRAGARGMLLPFGVCSPQATYEMFAAWKDDDQPLAEEKYERVRRAAVVIEGEMGVAGLKAACDLNGYYGGSPRLPGLPLLRDQKDEAQRLMRGMRN